MADLKIEDAAPDTNVTGVELMPVSDGGAAKNVSAAQIKDYVLAQIVAIAAASTVDLSTNGVYLKQGDSLVPFNAQAFAQTILNYAFGLAGASSLSGNEVFAIKNGSVLQTTTLSAIKAWVQGELADTHIAALDTAAALADENLAAVSQSGTDKKVTLALLRTYCLAGLYAAATASTAALGDTDYIFVYRQGQLQKVAVSDAGFATGDVSGPSEPTEDAIPQWGSDGKTLTAGLAVTDSVAASPQGATRIPSEVAVRAAVNASGVTSQERSTWNAKQNALTFDNAPTALSSNPVKSSGIKTALDAKQNALTFDSAPTAASLNPVTSGGVKTALDAKQDVLDFDLAPTSGSGNPVTSDGVAAALAEKQDTLTFDNTPLPLSSNPVTSGGIKAALDTKQGTLVFDDVPTALSSNPVKSGGVKAALDAKQGTLTFDTTPTANSTNPVTSGGIKAAIDAIAATGGGTFIRDVTVPYNSYLSTEVGAYPHYSIAMCSYYTNSAQTTTSYGLFFNAGTDSTERDTWYFICDITNPTPASS